MRDWLHTLMLGLMFWSCLVLVGCAGSSPKNQIGVSGTDFTTESDEPDARRRARLRIELASGYFEQNKTKIALDEIKQALTADDTYAPAYNLRGLVYMRLSELKLAEDSFRRALQLNPRDANAAHNLGWLTCQQDRHGEASALFDQAMGQPSYAGAAKTLMAKGVCQARAGQFDMAHQSLLRSLELDPGSPVTAYNLALVLVRQGQWVNAQFHLRRLNNGDYANAETLWLGIKVERRLGNRTAAAQLGDQLRRRYPGSKELNQFERGEFDE